MKSSRWRTTILATALCIPLSAQQPNPPTFPTNLPGAASITITYAEPGTTRYLVHLRQRHPTPYDNKRTNHDRDMVLATQDDLYHTLKALHDQQQLHHVYQEGYDTTQPYTELHDKALSMINKLQVIQHNYCTNNDTTNCQTINNTLKDIQGTWGAVGRLYEETRHTPTPITVTGADNIQLLTQGLAIDTTLSQPNNKPTTINTLKEQRTKILKQRDEYTINLISHDNDHFIYLILGGGDYGGAHDYVEQLATYNRNAKQKIGLINITPNHYYTP